MHADIERLMIRSDYATADLIRGREAWCSLDADGRAEFAERRRLIVRRTAGAYYRAGQEIQTSGSTAGMARRYRWGPRMWDFHAYHRHLCFGDLGQTVQYYLHLETGGAQRQPFHVSEEKEHSEGRIRFVVLDDPERDAERLRDALIAEARRPLVWIMPQQAETAIRRDRKVFEVLGEAHPVFHSTGEPCPEATKDYFRDRGLKLRDTMRVWNGGVAFYTCPHGGVHWDDFAAGREIRDGDLHASDYWNLAQYFWDYPTGDRLAIEEVGPCACGLPAQRNTWESRTLSVELPDGRIFRYEDLRATFIAAARANEDTLVGVNFGVGPNQLAVFYEFLNPDWVVPPGTAERLTAVARLPASMRVRVVRDQIYGTFKPRRLFKDDDETIDRIVDKCRDV